MKTDGKIIAKIIGVILVLLVVTGLVAIIYKFTNGFNEEFKTFYVDYGGEQILSADSNLALAKNETHRFDVKYTFDTPQSEVKGYSVEIIPNAERDFDFTVDGERYLYSKQDDMSAAFGLKKSDTYFELTIPQDFSLEYALQSCYPGKEVIVPEEAISSNAYPYMLVVSSYNGNMVYHIALSVGTEVTGVTLDPSQIIFTGSQE